MLVTYTTSDWAIAVVGAMEAALSIVFKKPALTLSTAIIVSCANSWTINGSKFANDIGCYKGDYADALIFMSEFSIPMVGVSLPCSLM